ncbi:MAG: glycosyltransferase family 2 protein [Atopobiaceae bacterium]|nr:glycosyltransferase family 2 protein [Atopobiaceae bacterium]
MRREKTLTISVAAYNMENYLRKALDSLCDSDVLSHIEVFVIDDGSTDETYSIAQEYAAAYPDTFFAIHKENEGYGSTVNWSLKHATGKYFKILDADGWFVQEGLKKLVRFLEITSADIVVTPYWEGPRAGKMQIKNKRPVNEGIQSVDCLKNATSLIMYELAIKTSILRQNKILLPHRRLYTDAYMCVMPLKSARTVQFLPDPVYCLWYGRFGQSMSPTSLINHVDDLLQNHNELIEFCNQEQGSANYQTMVHQVSALYNFIISVALKHFPVSQNTRDFIIQQEQKARASNHDIYRDAISHKSKTALYLRLMRMTGYRSYWLMRIMRFART